MLIYILLISLFYFSFLFVDNNIYSIEFENEYDLMLENSQLLFYMNPEDASFAVESKDNGKLWFSNPPDWQTKEQTVRGRNRSRLGSQAIINYYGSNNQSHIMDTYNDSIQYRQFEINKFEDRISVSYVLGEQWGMRDRIPLVIREEAFEEILDKLSQFDRDYLLDHYSLVTIEEIEDGFARHSVSSMDKEDVFGDYYLKILDDSSRRTDVLLSFLDNLYLSRSDLSGRGDIRKEDLLPLRGERVYVINKLVISPRQFVGSGAPEMSQWDQEDISVLMIEAGFTPEMVQIEHEKYNFGPPSPSQEVFEIVLEYRLDEDNLLVEVPTDKIEIPLIEDDNGITSEIPLYNLHLLPYLAAGYTDVEGYIVVPDGSGALIYMNEEKSASPYSRPLYGVDRALAPQIQLNRYNEDIQLPVFGLKQNDIGLLGIIEEGSSIARIEAQVSGQLNSYNSVSASFDITPAARMEQEMDFQTYIFQARPIDNNIRMRYSFLDQESSSYVAMAHLYQDYLFGDDNLKNKEDFEVSPLYLNIIGGIDNQEAILGFPRRIVKPLTSYSQAPKILDSFIEEGVEKLRVNYQGWLDGGIKHYYPNKINLEKNLGTEDEFLALLEYANHSGIDLFMEVDFLNIYHDKILDGFSPGRDSSRFLNRRIAQGFEYNLNTMRASYGSRYFMHSPRRIANPIESFLEDYKRYNLSGLSLSNMANNLYSDFREDLELLVDREEAINIFDDQMSNIVSETGKGLMVQGGFAYSLPYAEVVMNAPMTSSQFNIIDQDIPFYQIVLRGYVDYTLEPMNLSRSSAKNVFLKSLETGAFLSFTLGFEESSVIKDTDYHKLYSLDYENQIGQIMSYYTDSKDFYSRTSQQKIVNHEKLADQVYKTTFASGDSIIVNYSHLRYEDELLEVMPGDYIWLKGGSDYE